MKIERIGLLDEDKNEERVQIETLSDIYNHADHIRKTLQFCEDDEYGRASRQKRLWFCLLSKLPKHRQRLVISRNYA